MLYPEVSQVQVTATSNTKASYCKTLVIKRTDNTFLNTISGANIVKAILPADATLQDINILALAGSNAGVGASVAVGAILPFTSISAAGTVATVTCPVVHNLVVGDTFVVNGSGVAAFDAPLTAQATVASVPTANTFTYTVATTTATATVGVIGVTSYFHTPPSAMNTNQLSPAVGASPYSYTAPAVGDVVVSGGTVSAITRQRPGQAAVTLGVTAGIIPVQQGDVVAVTYTAAPTLTYIPADRSAAGYLSTVTKRAGPPSVGWVNNSVAGVHGTRTGMVGRQDVQLFGYYTESGAASTSGGPWVATVWYFR